MVVYYHLLMERRKLIPKKYGTTPLTIDELG